MLNDKHYLHKNRDPARQQYHLDHRQRCGCWFPPIQQNEEKSHGVNAHHYSEKGLLAKNSRQVGPEHASRRESGRSFSVVASVREKREEITDDFRESRHNRKQQHDDRPKSAQRKP